jgi:hypothetical protein
VRKHAAKCNRSPDEGVEFFVAADGQLQVPRGNTLDFQIFGGIAGKLEDFSSQVFEDCRNVDSSCGWNIRLACE